MSAIPADRGLLRQIHLHLNRGCGFSCRCGGIFPTTGENVPKVTFLPLPMALQAVREAMPVGLQAVHLDGDDTLFYPELEALLDHLESLELAIQLETNGAGLTPPRASRLGRLPQSTVTITFHGVDSATHDGYTGRPGAFDYATRAVRILSSAGLLVQVVYPVRRRSAPQIPALVKLVEELGGDTIRFVLPSPGPSLALKSGGNGDGAHAAGSPPSPQGSSFSDDILTVEELIALSWRIERELAYGTPLHLVFEQPPAFRGLHPKARVDGQERCGILNSLNVTPAGEYTLCGLSQAFPGLVLGRVGDDSLAAIWASHPLLQLLRSGLPDRLQGVCGRCTMKSTCLGECVIENKLHTGSFWSPGWFCEAAERVGLFPAGRLIENTW